MGGWGEERGTCAVRFLGKKEIVTKVDIWEIGGFVAADERRRAKNISVFGSLFLLNLYDFGRRRRTSIKVFGRRGGGGKGLQSRLYEVVP